LASFTAFSVQTYIDDDVQIVIRQVRTWLRDFAPANALMDGEEFEDGSIELFIDMALDDWSSTPPLIGRIADVRSHPSRFLLILKVVQLALMSASFAYARNNLTYSDGGITVATSDKAPMYLRIEERLRSEYDLQKMRMKRSINAESAYGGVHSEYITLGTASGLAVGSFDTYNLVRFGLFV